MVQLWGQHKADMKGLHCGTGILKAGLAQLPLTTLNSVVAVCQLSADLFPMRPARPAAVACSVGAMNLVGAWFGAMPCCHGAGGLAGQVSHFSHARNMCRHTFSPSVLERMNTSSLGCLKEVQQILFFAFYLAAIGAQRAHHISMLSPAS